MTRFVDCGNRRYAASQVSSFAGGLLNGQHARSTFYTITPDEDGKLPSKFTIEGEEPENKEGEEGEQEGEEEKEIGSDEEAEVEDEGEKDEDGNTIENDDALTVATSALDTGTTASMPASYFSKRAEEFHEQLRAEKRRRM